MPAGAATLSVAALSTNVEFLTALTFATGVIVALVPEGLLPTLSVSLAIGARRMAERGAAIRRLSAVEAVGSVTVICTDKTGTLTQNTLSVLASSTGAERRAGNPRRSSPPRSAMTRASRRQRFAGDAIDVAPGALDGRVNAADLTRCRRAHRRIGDMPFDASRRYMSVTCGVDGAERDFIKGAPEAVLALAATAPRHRASPTALAAATRRGERVILLASGPRGQTPAVLGLVRLYDPPRPEVPAAIVACRRAGIRVVMLTGDHPSTAQAVAVAIGMADGELPVVDGATVDQLSDAQLLVRLRTDAIFARIDPRQKLRITMLLRRAGDIVVVTGDGINDAPALRAADVGVAMGRRGTEVAKQAADIVLADDNFATIVAAIEEGRSIKANIRRFASYVFTSNVAELAPFLLFISSSTSASADGRAGARRDLGTDLSAGAAALGAELPSSAVMGAPPEPPERPLLTAPLVLKTFLFFGVIEAALGTRRLLLVLRRAGLASIRVPRRLLGVQPVDAQARAVTFLGIVSGQVGCVFAQRDGSFRQRLSLTSNAWIRWGLLFELALALTLVYVPGINGLFSMEGVPPAWLAILPLGAATFFLIDHARRSPNE